MCVDDQPFNFIPLKGFLTTLGVSFETFTYPETALWEFKKSLEKRCCNIGYTLIITDI